MNSPASGSPEPGRKQFPPWSILGAFVFFFIVWLLGWPTPAMDDLFYNGAAMNMAGGGDFSNPFLARQNFPSHYFFVYPPIHPYATYVWLSIFGVSASSLLAWQNFVFFIAAAMMIILIRREKGPELLCWIVPWGVLAVFLKFGLRPEAFAVAVTMTGYTLLVYCRKIGVPMWVAFFLIFVGSSAAPRTSFFGAVFALLAAWQWMKPPATNSVRLKFCLVSGTALAAAIFVFMACIHFRFAEFYHTFHTHSTRMNPDSRTLLLRELRQFGMRWFPICLLAIVLLVLALRRRVGPVGLVCYCIAIVFLLEGITGILGPGSSWYLVFIIFLLAAALSHRLSRCWNNAITVAIAVILIGVNGTKLIEQYGIWTGKIEYGPSDKREAVLALAKDHPIIVDSVTARYVFDYKMPPTFLDFGFASPFPSFFPTDVAIRPEDIYVIGPGKVLVIDEELHAKYPVEFWSMFNVKGRSYFKYPCRPYIIPATDCIPLKAAVDAMKK